MLMLLNATVKISFVGLLTLKFPSVSNVRSVNKRLVKSTNQKQPPNRYQRQTRLFGNSIFLTKQSSDHQVKKFCVILFEKVYLVLYMAEKKKKTNKFVPLRLFFILFSISRFSIAFFLLSSVFCLCDSSFSKCFISSG